MRIRPSPAVSQDCCVAVGVVSIVQVRRRHGYLRPLRQPHQPVILSEQCQLWRGLCSSCSHCRRTLACPSFSFHKYRIDATPIVKFLAEVILIPFLVGFGNTTIVRCRGCLQLSPVRPLVGKAEDFSMHPIRQEQLEVSVTGEN